MTDNTFEPGSEKANKIFNKYTHGSSLEVKQDPRDFNPNMIGAFEIARINLRSTIYYSFTITGDLICRVYHIPSGYAVSISAANHPGFEDCYYEATGFNAVGMLAMNEVLEKLRTDREWFGSMPEGAILESGKKTLDFLFQYMGTIFASETEANNFPCIQQVLDRIKNDQVISSTNESSSQSKVSAKVIKSGNSTAVITEEHNFFVNTTTTKPDDQELIDVLTTPVGMPATFKEAEGSV